jgi:hypothetical protein
MVEGLGPWLRDATFEEVLCSTFCIWLQCIICSSYYSLCVSLCSLRSYSITYTNFKVLIFVRGNALFMCFVAACVYCVVFRAVWRYELIQVVDIGWHVMQWTMGVQHFSCQGPYPLLWAGSRVVRGNTSSVRHDQNYCGWRPLLGDPCRNRNCTLNRSLGTLRLWRAPLMWL